MTEARITKVASLSFTNGYCRPSELQTPMGSIGSTFSRSARWTMLAAAAIGQNIACLVAKYVRTEKFVGLLS